MTTKIDWLKSGALKELMAARKAGVSFKDFLVTLRDKYGVSVTVARLSQVYKKYALDLEADVDTAATKVENKIKEYFK